MSDLDGFRAQRDAHRGMTVQQAPSRYSEAINRYLGAVGYREAEPPAPAPARTDVPAGVTSRVVVGVDDTPTSSTVVDHAAIEAELWGSDLHIVHVQYPSDLRPETRETAERLLERLTDRVRACSPSVRVTSELAVSSMPARLLSDVSDAGLLVVGHRHSAVGVAFGLSVSDRVAAQHRGAVLVVRVPGWPPGPGFGSRPVVVGADQAQSPAIRFALLEARARGCDLLMLRAINDQLAVSPPDVADDVRVTYSDVTTDPVTALIEESGRAAAIVVGRHETGGMSLGSVSRALVQRSHCPVFLV